MSSESTWADYTARTRWLWCLLGPGLLVALAVARLWLIEAFGWHGLAWPLLAWAVLVARAGLRLQRFRCPRCQQHFYHRHPRLLALRAQQCAHCCLPKD